MTTHLEKYLTKSPDPVTIEGTEKILEQMRKCVCKIHVSNRIKGTGFFTKILYNSKYLQVLITNQHVLTKDEINKTKKIVISLNNQKEFKTLKLDNTRLIYTDEGIDITMVEIKISEDKIENFLEIDEQINEEYLNEIYINKSIYVLGYPENKNIMV